MDVTERRGFSRIHPGSDQYASFPGGTAPIRELDLDGVTLEDSDPMPFDSFVRLQLHLGSELVDCTGRVTQSDPEAGLMAIKFSDLSSMARRSLMSVLVHTRMLENRRRLDDGLQSVARDVAGAPAKVRSLPPKPAGRTEVLGERLVRSGLISADQLAIASAHQRDHGGLLAVILVQFGAVSEGDLADRLHREYRVPLIELSSVEPTAEALQRVPLATAREHAILPIGLSGSTLTVAIADPSNVDGLAAVKFRSGCELRVTLAPARSLLQAIDRFYAERARAVG
jgi:hypothetical protein